MFNFIIDTSVFVLPSKSSDPEVEAGNLDVFKKNILCLEKLRQKESATISYINKTRTLLQKNDYEIKKSKIDARIRDLLESAPQYRDTIGFDSPFLEKWIGLIGRINPWTDAGGKYHNKGKIGIFNNIPDRDNDPDERYAVETELPKEDDIYPHLNYNFKKTFKKYCGYIADLNRKYDSSGINFIVLGEKFSKKDKRTITVTLKTASGKIQSQVSIVGIQKAQTLCESEIKFKNILSACEEGQKKFNSRLVFGKEVRRENIEEGILPQAGPPGKIYLYLETLYQVSELIINKNIDLCETTDFSLIEMLNAHGLLCSPDGDYIKNKCQARKFENESGKKTLFNIHLKPSTYGNDFNVYSYTFASKGTVRIYLEWDREKKKMRIGWIGRHPPSCCDCVYMDCKVKSTYKKN